MRWTANAKAAAVLAVRSGIITLGEAQDRYMLSSEEFHQWAALFDQDGLAGLHRKHLDNVGTKTASSRGRRRNQAT